MPKVKILEPRYYIPLFLKIRTKNAELVPFKLKPAQEKLLESVERDKRNNKPIRYIILKARQLGFSTMVEALIFNDETTNRLKNGMIVAHERPASNNLYQMYKTFYDNLPPDLTPMLKYSNAQEMLFENPTNDVEEKRRNPGLQSKISVVSAENVDAGRSQTIHNLHASEVAFWRDAKTLMTGLLQAVPDSPNTMVFIESTANGVGGWFYDFWKDAEAGRNDFTPLFFPWFEEPGYVRPFASEEEKQDFIREVEQTYEKDGEIIHTEEWELKEAHNLTWEQLNWRRYTIANKCFGDEEMFRQEYPSTPDEAFIASGRPKFNVTSLRKYKQQCKPGERGNIQIKNGTPVWVPDPHGYIEIWKHPQPETFYCIGADVAEGLATGDYSVGLVGDDDFNVVAAWYGHIDPDLFGKELVKLARYYNEAYLGVESNNHGLTTLKAIQNEEYYNIFFMKSFDKIADKITQKIGWQTNARTKPMMIDKLGEFLRERWLGIQFKTLIDECLTYIIEDNGATNAQEGCHDDTVMAMAILLQLLLEGKGENYIPEVPKDTGKSVQKRRFASRDDDEDKDEDDEENQIEIAR
jgi:hypothetical protein